MKESRYAEEHVAYALKQTERGTPVAGVCREVGISDAAFYNWRPKYGGLSLSDQHRVPRHTADIGRRQGPQERIA